MARPDTKVDIHGVNVSHSTVERSAYTKYPHQAQIMDNALKAEADGYDAFCVACTMDMGFYEIREIVSIPVTFLSESCFHLACLLADKFALLANSESSAKRLSDKAKQYDLQARLIPSPAFNITLLEMVAGFKRPEGIISVIEKAGHIAIDNGASILLPACNMLNMVLIEVGLRKIDLVPILDTAGAMVKMTELMVDLERIGISRSKTGLYTPLSKEDLTIIQELYKSSLHSPLS